MKNYNAIPIFVKEAPICCLAGTVYIFSEKKAGKANPPSFFYVLTSDKA